ncbi:transposase [Pseudomonas sp. RGM 3321]|uniref:IS110 family transposase n=1 Tax=Pseudomonas sp. RGM 3321 TaxID=2930089 RepID=UPI001FCA9344|nr:transposase [Pseudomonas sp. RGM 3321]MCJ2371129.1 transposase [Pseudomonas sp. RGM 3321]
MAMRVTLEKPIIGVDVAKNELVIYHDQYDRLEAIPNTKAAITQWLKALASSCAIAIEATNVYHVLFADAAHEAGCDVYMVDGYQLSHYRKGVNIRAKTDAQDARLLARYLKNELDELRPWIPASPLYRQLLSLFRRRAALVQRGEFSGANAFIACLGLDLRVSKSGQSDGPRRLTKRGDPEARRLLHNAAMSGSRTPAWKPFYEEQRKRGFSTTQALVMLARKLA